MEIPKTVNDARQLLELIKSHGSANALSKASKVPRQTMDNWVRKAQIILANASPETPFQFPEDADDDIPVEEIIANALKRNKKRIEAADSKKWFTIRVKGEGPLAVNWFGDPHLDDPYCNLELLTTHIDIIQKTERMYGANIGDSRNNWVGRLMKLYAEQDMGSPTARKLVRWFMMDSGVEWLLWLIGNHDAWNDGVRDLKEMGGHVCPMEDWRAQFKLVFPNGREILIDAAHDHKGQSLYNELHGQMRAALFGKTPHLVIAGDKHTPGIHKKWFPEEDMVTWLVRCGTYKWHDRHALVNGFPSYQDAPSMVTIFDPDAERPSRLVYVTDDVEHGADYLTWLRKKRGYVDSKKKKG